MNTKTNVTNAKNKDIVSLLWLLVVVVVESIVVVIESIVIVVESIVVVIESVVIVVESVVVDVESVVVVLLLHLKLTVNSFLVHPEHVKTYISPLQQQSFHSEADI